MSDPIKPGSSGDELPENQAEKPFNLDEVLQRASKRVALEQLKTIDDVRRALDVSTEIVTDPSAGRRLADRHNAHVRTVDIAEHAYEAMLSRGPGEHQEYFAWLRSHVKQHGLFVYPYTPDYEEGRIIARYNDDTPQYLIVESSGRHPDSAHGRHHMKAPAADAQFHLAKPALDAPKVIEWPRPNRRRGRRRDQLFDEDLIEEMKSMPYSVAVLDDIASDPDMGHLRLAGTALNRGINEIVHTVNATRERHPIRFIAAEIVSVQGFKMKSGKNIRLQSDLQIAPILNDRSVEVFAHFNSPDCESFETAWVRRDSLVPIEHPYVQGILVDWHVKVARLKQSSSLDDVRTAVQAVEVREEEDEDGKHDERRDGGGEDQFAG